MFQRYALLTLFPLLLGASSAWAADWQVETIEGRAKVQKGSVWTTLHVGDTVPNGAAIRTLADGSLELKRDAERIAMAPDTQIEIYERSTTASPAWTRNSGRSASRPESKMSNISLCGRLI